MPRPDFRALYLDTHADDQIPDTAYPIFELRLAVHIHHPQVSDDLHREARAGDVNREDVALQFVEVAVLVLDLAIFAATAVGVVVGHGAACVRPVETHGEVVEALVAGDEDVSIVGLADA